MLHRLTWSTTLPLPIDEVFRFFSDAANLETITPPELGFRILTSRPIAMKKGTVIDYRLRLFGVPFKWRTRITCWEPPHRFADVQERGPYRVWLHTHGFSESNGATTVSDDVEYALPLWPLSIVVLPLVRRQLERIFRFREQAIRAELLTESASHERTGTARTEEHAIT